MGTTPSQVHGTLEYVVSRALLEGKTGDTTVYVAMVDFETPHEEPLFGRGRARENADDLVLKVTISTEWVTRDDVAAIIETNLDDEDDMASQPGDEEENEDGRETEPTGEAKSTPNKAKKGH